MTDKQEASFRMNKSVRDVLRRIDTIFAAGGRATEENHYSQQARTARQLWDVLSALRGPDMNAESGVKDATTCIIRAAALPKTYGKGKTSVCIPASIGYDSPEGLAKRQGMDWSHFRRHARKAFDVLGLSWDEEVNNQERIDKAAKPFARKKSARS